MDNRFDGRAQQAFRADSIGRLTVYTGRTGPHAEQPLPAQHPRLPQPFVGRTERRAAADLALGNGRPVVVCGPPGSGRTELAGHVLQVRGKATCREGACSPTCARRATRWTS
ncbi:hypothetical protein [Kitasatospora sp. NPDC058046]|uniref:hypothetical protein n=1 Tax=Kitasatospora sp. NPDC058046 TaxID=3346312 RepID=UPI0036DF8320